MRWKDTGEEVWPNIFEAADNLVGWEKEMKAVDDQIMARADTAPVNLVQNGPKCSTGACIKSEGG